MPAGWEPPARLRTRVFGRLIDEAELLERRRGLAALEFSERRLFAAVLDRHSERVCGVSESLLQRLELRRDARLQAGLGEELRSVLRDLDRYRHHARVAPVVLRHPLGRVETVHALGVEEKQEDL